MRACLRACVLACVRAFARAFAIENEIGLVLLVEKICDAVAVSAFDAEHSSVLVDWKVGVREEKRGEDQSRGSKGACVRCIGVFVVPASVGKCFQKSCRVCCAGVCAFQRKSACVAAVVWISYEYLPLQNGADSVSLDIHES